MLAGHGELREFAQTFFETGFGKGCQGGKRLIHLALCEARSVRKASEACNGAGDLLQVPETAFLDGTADHAALGIVTVLHRINQGKSGFSLRQVIAQVLAQAGFVGLVIERIVDQLEGGADVLAEPCERLFYDRRGIAQYGADLRSCLEQPRGFAIDPKGRFLVVSGEKSDTISAYAIDEASGAVKLIGKYPAGKGANWVEIVSFD